MPDNVAITAGSGTTIGTDEVTIGGVVQHVQRVKLVDGADGSAALIGGDATNGLDVDVTRLPVGPGSHRNAWNRNHSPAAATKATIGQAAGAAGIRNVCTSITCTLSSAAAPTVGVVTFNLIDGASAGTTILWTGKLSLQAVAGVCAVITIGGLWIEGTAATAMTLETAAAPPAGVQATVAMTGTTVAA